MGPSSREIRRSSPHQNSHVESVVKAALADTARANASRLVTRGPPTSESLIVAAKEKVLLGMWHNAWKRASCDASAFGGGSRIWAKYPRVGTARAAWILSATDGGAPERAIASVRCSYFASTADHCRAPAAGPMKTPKSFPHPSIANPAQAEICKLS